LKDGREVDAVTLVGLR